MEHCQKTLEIDPNVFQAHAYLAMIHRRNERFEEALSEWQKLITSFGRPSLARSMRRTYGESGFGAALAQLAGSVARAAYLLQALSYPYDAQADHADTGCHALYGGRREGSIHPLAQESLHRG